MTILSLYDHKGTWLRDLRHGPQEALDFIRRAEGSPASCTLKIDVETGERRIIAVYPGKPVRRYVFHLAAQRPFVVVPCGGAKLARPAIAEELYTGSFHRLAMRAARAMTDRHRIRILSARYGLLELDDEVEPYEQRMDRPFALAGVDVVAQAERMGLAGEHPVLLLPAAYDVVATRAWPDNSNPLRGASGIGSMQHRLREVIESAAAAAERRKHA
jgi:hypothetical protein